MQYDYIIYLLIGVLVLSAITLFVKPIKAIAKLLLRCIIGVAALFTTDFLLSPLGLAVGINAFTAIITGILGIPGFIMLYALAFILQNT